MENISLVSNKVKYQIVDIRNKPQLDALFDKFNNCIDDEYFEVLKVQNINHDRLFPCFVVYAQHIIFD